MDVDHTIEKPMPGCSNFRTVSMTGHQAPPVRGSRPAPSLRVASKCELRCAQTEIPHVLSPATGRLPVLDHPTQELVGDGQDDVLDAPEVAVTQRPSGPRRNVTEPSLVSPQRRGTAEPAAPSRRWAARTARPCLVERRGFVATAI